MSHLLLQKVKLILEIMPSKRQRGILVHIQFPYPTQRKCIRLFLMFYLEKRRETPSLYILSIDKNTHKTHSFLQISINFTLPHQIAICSLSFQNTIIIFIGNFLKILVKDSPFRKSYGHFKAISPIQTNQMLKQKCYQFSSQCLQMINCCPIPQVDLKLLNILTLDSQTTPSCLFTHTHIISPLSLKIFTCKRITIIQRLASFRKNSFTLKQNPLCFLPLQQLFSIKAHIIEQYAREGLYKPQLCKNTGSKNRNKLVSESGNPERLYFTVFMLNGMD